MSTPTLDLHVLRTFVTGVELGGFGRASDRVGRSTSAISAQLKKLTDQAGRPILRKEGRRMVLTPAGEVLLGYARRLLELNDEALAALNEGRLEGAVRVGVQEDFGENFLSGVLGQFVAAHPGLTVEAQVARNASLLNQIRSGRLDLALAWESDLEMPHRETLGSLPMCWIGRDGLGRADRRTRKAVSLAAFEAPCALRTAATEALDRANIPWRIAFSGSSLAAVWAAVHAGLGITVRTPAGMPSNLRILPGMPRLPKIGVVLYRAEAKPSAAVAALATIVRHGVGVIVRGSGASD